MSSYNVIIAFSNFAAIPALHLSLTYPLTFIPLVFTFGASFISHLFESHKHGLSGFNCPPQVSYILNRFDVFGCILLTMRLLYLYYSRYQWNLSPFFSDPYLPMFTIFAFIFSILSEHQYWMNSDYNAYSESYKRLYLITHCLWHILIFNVIHRLLNILL